MSQMIEYIRKPGKISGYKIEKNEETGEMEIVPVYGKGEPYGCLYAKKVCGLNGLHQIAVGWSLCNKKDDFSKDEAVLIASDRAFNAAMGTKIMVPHSIKNDFIKFCERAKKFYRLSNFTNKYVVMKEEVLDV